MSFVKYRIKERFLAFKRRYLLYDDQDREIGYVSKHPFSLVKKATFYDLSDEVLFVISKKPFSFRPTYYIERRGEREMRIFRSLGFRPDIYVESLISSDAFMIQGNIWHSEYAFYKNDRGFAYVSRDIWKIPDSYGVAVDQTEDELIVLCMVIIIDLMIDSRRRKS